MKHRRINDLPMQLDPSSESRLNFVLILVIIHESISLLGDAHIAIEKKKKQKQLGCLQARFV